MRGTILWAGALACACSDPFGAVGLDDRDSGARGDARVSEARSVASDRREPRSVERDGGSGEGAVPSDASDSIDAGADSAPSYDAGVIDSGKAVDPTIPETGPPDPEPEPEESGTGQEPEDAGTEPVCPGFERWEVEVGECLYIKNATELRLSSFDTGECSTRDIDCATKTNEGQHDGLPFDAWITPYNPDDNTSVVVRYQLVDDQCPKVCQ
jgi:hypothetical protein